jgi:hypothetical protein
MRTRRVDDTGTEADRIDDRRTENQWGPAIDTEDVLFGGVEVGYNEDLLEWVDMTVLRSGLNIQIANVLHVGERIHDRASASLYFRQAALRKERVFLSYAGEDARIGEQFSEALHRYFQDVFDYRRPQAIPLGANWIEELFTNLSKAAVGILLISHSYAESAYCLEESRVLRRRALSDSVHLYTVRLDDVQLREVSALTHLDPVQYADLSDPARRGVDGIVREIVEGLPLQD